MPSGPIQKEKRIKIRLEPIDEPRILEIDLQNDLIWVKEVGYESYSPFIFSIRLEPRTVATTIEIRIKGNNITVCKI